METILPLPRRIGTALARWLDSSAGAVLDDDDQHIDWLRTLPFIALHAACVAVIWVGVSGVAVMERALDLTIAYVKERKAFGQRLIDFQNTQFKLAECKTEATVGKVFCHHCVDLHLRGKLDATMASMAKLWLTDTQCKIVDECLQLHGGYGYMNEFPIARMFADSRVQKIYGGTNEIMKLLIARSL